MLLSPHDNPDVVFYGGNKLFRTADRGHTWQVDQPGSDAQPGMEEAARLLRARGERSDDTPVERRRRERLRDDHDDRGVAGAGGRALRRDRRWACADVAGRREVVAEPDVEASGCLARDGSAASWRHDTAPARPMSRSTGTRTTTSSRTSSGRPTRRDSWTSIAGDHPGWGRHQRARRASPPTRICCLPVPSSACSSRLDGGRHWTRAAGNLPRVPVDDIVFSARDNDLILGTHGRSIIILDDITPLEHASDDLLRSDVHLFTPRPAIQHVRDADAADARRVGVQPGRTRRTAR